MRITHLIILSIALINCASDNVIAQKRVTAKWVDVNTNSDTLTFLTIGIHDYIQLNRGMEIINGYLRPKNGSGPYAYKLITDTISLNWTLSSDSHYHDYYFRQASDTIIVENFYEPHLKGKRQTFKRLK